MGKDRTKFSRDECLESIARSLGRFADAHERLGDLFERQVELGEQAMALQTELAELETRSVNDGEVQDALTDNQDQEVEDADVVPLEAAGGE